ncbi:hypothetical protein HID58_059151 [Brassica napus]|uniref:Uncharacterized protein n=1 Tax=Brassica napus TaxID=3708 RepID=A0ABQ7ZS24_BRANA|nr:hypothetical protein HID58_059151 [Brassica napus]
MEYKMFRSNSIFYSIIKFILFME